MAVDDGTRIMLARERAEYWSALVRWAATRKDKIDRHPVTVQQEEADLLSNYWSFVAVGATPHPNRDKGQLYVKWIPSMGVRVMIVAFDDAAKVLADVRLTVEEAQAFQEDLTAAIAAGVFHG